MLKMWRKMFFMQRPPGTKFLCGWAISFLFFLSVLRSRRWIFKTEVVCCVFCVRNLRWTSTCWLKRSSAPFWWNEKYKKMRTLWINIVFSSWRRCWSGWKERKENKKTCSFYFFFKLLYGKHFMIIWSLWKPPGRDEMWKMRETRRYNFKGVVSSSRKRRNGYEFRFLWRTVRPPEGSQLWATYYSAPPAACKNALPERGCSSWRGEVGTRTI